LSAANGEFLSVSRPDFSDHIQTSWNLLQISGANGISITGSARKWREVAVGQKRFCQDPPGCSHKVNDLDLARPHLSGMLLDDVPGLFKAHHASR
jgi:hypothetical protein